MNTRLLRAWWPALIGSIIFVTSAILLIPYPGLQEDELIFAPSIFNPGIHDHMTLGRHAVRVPVILLYALTMWVFYDVHLVWVRVSAHGGRC